MKNNTTIKLSKKTKQRLDNLKEYNRETYEEIIMKILHILNQIRKDPISGNRLLSSIDRNIRRKQIFNKQVKSKKTTDNSQKNNKVIED